MKVFRVFEGYIGFLCSEDLHKDFYDRRKLKVHLSLNNWKILFYIQIFATRSFIEPLEKSFFPDKL